MSFSALMDWLFDKTPDESTPPPFVKPRVTPLPSDADDPEYMRATPTSEVRTELLDEVFTVIDYEDSEGNETRRRITLRKLSTGPYAPMLQAICHERRSLRTFRCDRILNFIDPTTGEVFTASKFFGEIMGLNLREFEPGEEQESLNQAKIIRDALRPALSILISAARADDQLHPKEMEAIIKYIHEELKEIGLERGIDPEITQPVEESIKKTVTLMRPQRSSLRGYLDRMASCRESRVNRFLNAVGEVVGADGVVVPEEEEFLAGLGLLIEKAK